MSAEREVIRLRAELLESYKDRNAHMVGRFDANRELVALQREAEALRAERDALRAEVQHSRMEFQLMQAHSKQDDAEISTLRAERDALRALAVQP